MSFILPFINTLYISDTTSLDRFIIPPPLLLPSFPGNCRTSFGGKNRGPHSLKQNWPFPYNPKVCPQKNGPLQSTKSFSTSPTQPPIGRLGPALAAHARKAPKDVLRIDLVLDAQEARLIGAPEDLLETGFERGALVRFCEKKWGGLEGLFI